MIRRFDHEEALEMFRSGETLTAIAKGFGVSQQAVSSALCRLRRNGGEIDGPTVEEMLSKCRG